MEHNFEGAYCTECGADEASSFADTPCEGFTPATSPVERKAEREALAREQRQESLLDASDILADHRRERGEL